MAFNISYVFQAIDKFTAVANKIKNSMDGVQRKAVAATQKIRNIGKAATQIGRDLLPLSGSLALVAGFALNASAKMETLTTSFKTMTGSAENANKLVRDLRDFAAKTPFQLEGIGQSTKQLLAFGVTQDNVLNRLKMLGDISAGAGVPLRDMAAIFGKVKAKGKVMTEELLQMSDRGIPIIDILAKGFGVTKDKVFEMASKSQISFAAMVSAMEVMTGKGGIFFDQMGEQSRTLAGLFSTFKDNIFDALVEIGDQLVETFEIKKLLTDLTEGLKRATQSFKNFVKENPRLAKFLFIALAITAALAPLLIIIGLMAQGVAALATVFGLLGGVFGFISLPILAIIAAVVALVAAFLWLRANWTEVSNAIGGTIEQIGINFGLMVDKIKGFFTDLGKTAKLVFDASPLGKLVSLTSGLFSGGETSATIDVNINDPGGAVESVSTATAGSGVDLSVGQNMGG